MPLPRRSFLCLSVLGVVALTSARSRASIARAVGLTALAKASERAVFGHALDAESRWETFAGRRRIVTYTRLGVDETLGGPSGDSELLVRTLGGQVGDVGQVVEGEALLLVGEPALVFLTPAPDGVLAVTAMAQGHFPIRTSADGEQRLVPSPRLPELVGADESAAKALSGRRKDEARARVGKAWRDAH